MNRYYEMKKAESDAVNAAKAVNDLKTTNDIYGIAIQIYAEEKQRLSDRINACGIVIELD